MLTETELDLAKKQNNGLKLYAITTMVRTFSFLNTAANHTYQGIIFLNYIARYTYIYTRILETFGVCLY